ncbi:CoA transferase [Pseudomonas sp. 7P_10.2_Bac1]|nr:CoA transferase [Pseudomonas sp. 7P_10.2_Bac1]MCU1726953.1 CoA transferase [Pseudomonas sp. 7P_10.2_Bac1]
MTQPAMLHAVWTALGGDVDECTQVTLTTAGALSSAYPVTDLASASMAAVALAIAKLRAQHRGQAIEPLQVDRRLASIWFGTSLRPVGWQMPNVWDPVAGDYKARDGWIRLHTNAPHHRLAAERILGPHADKTGMAQAVSQWRKEELEAAIVEAGGCAAQMLSTEAWARHPQGRAVADEPLVHLARRVQAHAPAPPVDLARPLAGIKVLDLTRVLAGPIATRCLAAYGAEVLRIDSPDWNEPGIVPEVTLGKRLVRLNLRDQAALATVKSLLALADVIVHGYRADALEHLGLGTAVRQQINPRLIDVSLNAYGWTGPWCNRRGFDSLVQMSSGIADSGMQHALADKPVPLPVQALDHATGYLMAAAVITGITERLQAGTVLQARLSLARTAKLLQDYHALANGPVFAAESDADKGMPLEHTSWGDAQRILWPIHINGCHAQWALPAHELGSDAAHW